MHEYLTDVDGLCPPPEPYSYAVQAGRTLYLAGQVALDDEVQIVGSNLSEQAAQVWRNIEAVLARSGATLHNIVKVTYYLRDIRDLPQEIEIRATLFPPDRLPAVTAVQVAALGLPGLLVEIDVIAVLDDD